MAKKQIRDASPAELLAALRSSNAINRVEAAQRVSELPVINQSLAQEIQARVLYDDSASVRHWAQKAMATPAYLASQAKLTSLAPSSKKLLVKEIDQWLKEGLVDDELAGVLLARYGKALKVAPEPAQSSAPQPASAVKLVAASAPARPPKPRRSLTEVLFSQTTINIALFLGAFFVLGAALILAALNAFLRIPVLAIVSIIFLGGAVGLRRRMVTASLTLFIVYSLLVPILTRVVLETSGLPLAGQRLTWIAVTLFLTANWAYATRLYRSRIFAILTFAAFNSLGVQVANWLTAHDALGILLSSITNFVSLLVILRIKTNKALYTPLFVASQVMQFFVLLGTWSVYSNRSSFGAGALWMLALAATLVISAIHNHVSYSETKLKWLPAIAAASLVFVPFLVLWPSSLPNGPYTAVILAWGSLFAIVGHNLGKLKKNIFEAYEQPLLWGSGILYAVVFNNTLTRLSGLLSDELLRFSCFMVILLVYGYLTLEKRRHLVWGAALLAFYLGYWTFLSLPILAGITMFSGYLALWPALILIAADLLAWKFWPSERILYSWPRAYAVIATIVATLGLFYYAYEDPLRLAIGFSILTAATVVYAAMRRSSRHVYVPAVFSTLSVFFFAISQDVSVLTYPMFALGVIYYAAGSWLLTRKGADLWARPLNMSGLILVGLVSLLGFSDLAPRAHLFVVVAAVACFVTADLQERLRKPRASGPAVLIRLGGALVVVYGVLLASLRGESWPLYAGLAFGIYGLLFVGYALISRVTQAIYLGTAGIAAATYFVADHFGFTDSTLPLLALAAAFYLGGYFMFGAKRLATWARAVHYSGVALIGFVAVLQFRLPSHVQQIEVLAVAVVAFVLADLAERLRKPVQPGYRSFTRIGSFFFGAISVLTLYINGHEDRLVSAAVFGVYAGLFVFYAIANKTPKTAYLSTVSLVGVALNVQAYLNLDNWLPGFVALGLVLLVAAYVPKWKKENADWKHVLETSAYGINLFVAATALFYVDEIAIISVAIAATVFAFRALRRRSVGSAAVADFLFLEAYLMALNTLDVSEPQFYSMGAALLGLVMHYILMRSESSSFWTFAAGMLSQLVLLSTTFYQMVATGELQYFFILFFQSLAVIAYGIVIRSRSLVIVPIAFTILAVVTVIYSKLSGISTLVIIGGSGFLLLILAIGALFLRERISDTTEKVRAQLSGWSN